MDGFLEEEDCGTAYELDCECGNDCDLDFYEENALEAVDLSAARKPAPNPPAKPENAVAPKNKGIAVQQKSLTKKEKRKELLQVALGSVVISAIFLIFFVIRFLVV